MRRRRARGTGKPAAALLTDALCRGPGNLTRALGISLAQNQRDLVGSALRIEDAGLAARPVATSTRIGINVGVEKPWRFYVSDSPAVSRLR
jgi:DNA-3-methyladenine glycosylase